ncbi:MAG TPA: hypothetical protein VHM90_18140 [Phycisphaerae bacterium]|nr:hypothetical protein [Phycisphaerae bacterium]
MVSGHRRWSATLLKAALLAAALFAAQACDETTTPRAQTTQPQQVFISGAKVAMNGDPSSLFGDKPGPKTDAPILLPQEGDPSLDPTDPCAANLQELTGQLLLYYATVGNLPASLDQLPDVGGEKAGLACPKTSKPYVYFAAGLRAPADLMTFDRKTGNAQEGNMLILVDRDPAHPYSQRLLVNGKERVEKQTVRLGIVMEPPMPGKSVKMYVVPVQQALLDAYRRNAGI